MHKPNKKSRRFQFGIRAVLVLTTLFAVLFCYIGLNVYEGVNHQRIAKELQALGCLVFFTHNEMRSGPVLSDGGVAGNVVYYESTLPSYVERLSLGPMFRRIKAVNWQGSRSTADTEKIVKLLKSLREIESISISDSDISDHELSGLMNSIRTQKLAVSRVNLPRTEIDWLNRQNLKWLCVFRTQFSNAAIDGLPDTLEYLDATRTRISDEGLPGLVRLKNLKQLKLLRTPTSQAAIKSLQKEMPWCQITWAPL